MTCEISWLNTEASSDSLLGDEYQPRIDADEAARQRKRVDVVIIDGKELKIEGRFGTVFDQPAADLVQIIVDFGIVQIFLAGTDLHHGLLTYLASLLRGNCGLRDISQIGKPVAQGDGGKKQQQ